MTGQHFSSLKVSPLPFRDMQAGKQYDIPQVSSDFPPPGQANPWTVNVELLIALAFRARRRNTIGVRGREFRAAEAGKVFQIQKWDTRSTATIAVNGTTDHRRQVTTYPGRLFTRLPATESGATSAGALGQMTRSFAYPWVLPI